MATVRAHVVISGMVQGVCFRMYAKNEALKLGLTGWVRNVQYDKVEAVFEGDKHKINAMIEWCKIGSSSAKVDDVDVNWEESSGEFASFSIGY